MAEELHFARGRRGGCIFPNRPYHAASRNWRGNWASCCSAADAADRVALTDAGKIYQQRAQSIMAQLDEAGEEASSRVARGDEGTLTRRRLHWRADV